MTDEIQTLRAEVAALRAELLQQRADQDQAITRRRLLTGLAGLGAVGAASVAAAPAASAADGDPILLGEQNTATGITNISTTTQAGTSDVDIGTGIWGVVATGESVGLVGHVSAGGVAGVWGHVEGPGGSGVTGNAVDAGGIAIIASSKAGPAIGALSELDGVTLELTPADRTGPPTSMPAGVAEYRIGMLSVDGAGQVWLCTATGAPGQWTRLLREDTARGRVIPITPFRALDTRATGGRPAGSPAITGQRKGPIRGGETVTLHLRDHPDIPATATGAFGRLCVVNPSYSGSCPVLPSGGSTPASAVTFWKGVNALSNSYTSGLGTAGLSLKPSGASSNTVHLTLDVAGYLT